MSNDPFNFNFPFINMMPEDVGDPNLLVSGMKMMSQAWQNFATMTPQAPAMSVDPNELDKRIEELKAVESWLKLNLSMLSSSIHSLELQKSNLEHFSSFMEMMSEPIKATVAATEAATQKKQAEEPVEPIAPEPQAEAPTDVSHDDTKASTDTEDDKDTEEKPSLAETSALMQDQALNWFNLLGDQFKNIVATVAATSAASDAAAEEAAKELAKTTAAKKTTTKKAASKTSTKRATKTAAKKSTTSKKTAAKKTTVKKTAAKKSAK